MLRVYEFDSSVQPGALANHFEVYSKDKVEPIFYAESLDEAVKFCYDSGHNFTVHTVQSFNNGE